MRKLCGKAIISLPPPLPSYPPDYQHLSDIKEVKGPSWPLALSGLASLGKRVSGEAVEAVSKQWAQLGAGC